MPMMKISLDQVRIFEKYAGDTDGFARIASRLERRTMTADVWPVRAAV
jgi:hypothetical protein